jgi:phosphatidate cytidylyltransferase
VPAAIAEPLPAYTAAAGVVMVVLSGAAAATRLSSAWRPIGTWLLMAPVIVGALWMGSVPWALLVTVASVMAFAEYSRATGLRDEPALVALVTAGIVAANASAVLGWTDGLAAVPVVGVIGLTIVPVVRNRVDDMLRLLSLAILGLLFFGFFLAHLSLLGNGAWAVGLLLFVVLTTQLNDALAFMFGKLFGRHRWTVLSPSKTVEGSLLAIAATLVLAIVQWPLAFPRASWWEVAAMGLAVGIGGQLGDLTMALVKRTVGIKDFGTMLPGHGGITDRLNSLMVTAPLCAFLGGWLPGMTR